MIHWMMLEVGGGDCRFEKTGQRTKRCDCESGSPQPRYEESYSIAPILDFIIALGSNDVMSFDQLRSKVVILLQVFSLKRSKDVASIVSSFVVLNFDSKVSHFRMRGDKAVKGSGHINDSNVIWDLGIIVGLKNNEVRHVDLYISMSETKNKENMLHF